MKLEDLLRLEYWIEEAWCKILKEAGGNPVPEFSDQNADRPCYQVKLTGLSETGGLPFKRRNSAGQLVTNYRQWKGTLVTRTVTKRFENSNDQAEMITRVRMTAFDFLARFNDATLPYHWVTWMREVNTSRQHIVNGEWDETEQHHEIMFEIRVEALPQESVE